MSEVASEGRELSAELARRSVVLAQNSGVLPLAPGGRVAVIGPHADAVGWQFPTYTYPGWREAVAAQFRGEPGTMLGAAAVMKDWYDAVLPDLDIEQIARQDRYRATSLVDEIGRRAQVQVARGCGLVQRDEAELDAAVAAAQAADVVVLALGGASLWYAGERTEGVAADTADIALPAAQSELADAVAATGTPMIVVLVQGRPYSLPASVEGASAVLVSAFGGAFGPAGVAEVLFGETNPSGKLTYSVPRHTGQIPVYHHQHAGSGYRSPLQPGVAGHYLDRPATPLWPFGHGLSYTDFELSDLLVDEQVPTDGGATATVTVTNVGSREGATVVQLYARVEAVGVTRPAQQLVGFARAELAAGERAQVRFGVDASQLAYVGLPGDLAVEPGRVELVAGLDSDDRGTIAQMTLIGDRRPVTASERTFLSTVDLTDG